MQPTPTPDLASRDARRGTRAPHLRPPLRPRVHHSAPTAAPVDRRASIAVRALGCAAAAVARLRRTPRDPCAAFAADRRDVRPSARSNGHIVVPGDAAATRARTTSTVRVHRRRRVAQPQRRLPLHAVRAGAGAPGVSLLRSAGSEGALDADARRPGGLAGGGERRRDAGTTRRRWPARACAFAETQPLPTYLFAFAAGKFSGRDRASATAARSACSTARPTPRRSRATATRSSICTPRRSPGSRTTPASRIRSASSTSC